MKTKWRIRGLLDDLKRHMTREQINEGERKARAWYANYVKRNKG
jgi:hypothetical protein